MLLIAATILAAGKLAPVRGQVGACHVRAIADALRRADPIMEEIDRRHPTKPAQQAEQRPADFIRHLDLCDGNQLRP